MSDVSDNNVNKILISKKQAVIFIILAIIVFVIIGYVKLTPSKPMSKQESRKELVSKGFSNWDGSHRSLESHIKSAMNDPKSYEHVSTVYWDRVDHLIVLTKFRGKNAFGATVINEVRAKVGIDGEVLEIIDTK